MASFYQLAAKLHYFRFTAKKNPIFLILSLKIATK